MIMFLVKVEVQEDKFFSTMKGNGFLFTTLGDNLEEIRNNFVDLIQDFLEQEGGDMIEYREFNLDDFKNGLAKIMN